MQLGASLIQYAVVGTFFWVFFLAISALSLPLGRVEAWTVAPLGDIPEGLLTPLGSLLAAIAITFVFVTGVVIDLIGISLFRATEARWLLKEVRRHSSWIEAFYTTHAGFLGVHYDVLVEDLRETARRKARFWHAIRHPIRADRASKRQLSAGSRLFELLLAIAQTGADASSRIALWRVSRALSTAMAMVVLAAIIPMFAAPPGARTILVEAGIVLPLILTAGGISATSGIYRDMLQRLLASTYVAVRQSNGSGGG